ncbi:MAG: outer membrane lipid asymmetry maintenance protein MlaD [Pseudomonadota bacterium]|uniref:outer membrane lipid asymmetry maintenance protein MlaD n=1 Tax=Rhizorhabdus phycosphaerae TaxID=2711156 RepID=UPI0013EDEE57|nr:outer membrane lipid asymmetry maintenance protein MlaD [Rhizorhabdus phycosphaerae]
MRPLLRENIGEALVGLFVILFAGWFVWFAYGATGGGAKAGAIHVTAFFPNSTGINVGSDVRVAGMKVGTVAAQALDPQSYQVKVKLALDPAVKLPADSSAAITSEGFLGATFISLIPGGDTVALKDGDTIADTQGAMDLMGMVGQFINKSGGSSGGGSDEAAKP